MNGRWRSLIPAIAACWAMAGCCTNELLDQIAREHPMSVDIKPTEWNQTKPQPREKLIGKWEGHEFRQELLWMGRQGNTKKFPVHDLFHTFEFREDGRFFYKGFSDGKLQNENSGTWKYVINESINGAELTMTGWKYPFWCVFWSGDDNINITWRNSDIGNKISIDRLKNTYGNAFNGWTVQSIRDGSWEKQIAWIRSQWHRRELWSTKEKLRRCGEASKPTPLPGTSPCPSPYNILSCERESGSDFAYRFVLELTGEDKSLKTFRSVQREFREAVKEDYTESFPGVRQNDLYVDFPEYKLNNGKIEGRAVVLTISVVAMKYDPSNRAGKLSIRVNANQYEEARKWVRKNIETLARDKNIALTTGEIPPAAKFYLGREELKDGNILEIEFKTE
ncbi:MAG: hypothetical protein IJG84_02760 [Kiritimatiellae bacterium]|nr:hypothetical protein [Kiritimatiellia bacterium]